MPNARPKILFISHSYPPIVGGVETHNSSLFRALTQHADLTLLANRKRFLLPLFFVFAALRAAITSRKYDVVLLGSCILANVAWFIRLFSNKPVVAVAHGLDLTWKNPVYQFLWIKTFLPKINRLIAVGHETVNIAIQKHYPPNQIVFIPNGVDFPNLQNEPTPLGPPSACSGPSPLPPLSQNLQNKPNPLETLLGQSVQGKKILITSGRLAKRKGVAWFISNVLPQLDDAYLYVVAGDGPDKPNIQNAIETTRQQHRVILLGYVPDSVRNLLLASAHLFVQPNIPVPNNIEGFGISVIEAGAAGLPVLASNLEGLKDAVAEGCNGFLVEPLNAKAYLDKINALFAQGNPREILGPKAKQHVLANHSWETLSLQYLDEIRKTLSPS